MSLDISFVIASFNSARWLPSTLKSISKAVKCAMLSAEVIVVDDGSIDQTIEVLSDLQNQFEFELRIIQQDNQGRFLARWNAANVAKSSNLLIIDSRILLGETSLRDLFEDMQNLDFVASWNAHVVLDPNSPLIGRFWEVPTYMFWGKYLSNPQLTTLNEDNFDRHPKGTTAFFVQKELFIQACLASWPAENAHLTSDDTKLLRYILGKTPIVIDPKFEVTYRPRTTLKAFLKHTFVRGTLFVDSYAGTSLLRDTILNLFVISPLLLAALLVGLCVLPSQVIVLIILALVLLVSVPVFIAFRYKCALTSIVSYYTYVIPFAVCFIAGVIRGRWVHRGNFHKAGAKAQQ